MSGPPRPTPPGRGVRRTAPLTRVDEVSAGGLVLDRRTPTARAALIARHDRRGRLVWSLPKGHLEDGESAEQAAVREVEEETGIRARVLAPLGTIDFWFVAEQRRVHKTVHHFLLEAHGGELSDADPEVVEVAWVPLDEVPERLAYADERRLLDRVSGLLAASDEADTAG
jgi:ADP-ribose pyrophosphatase YjhB (NUDIX family)